MKTVNMGEDVTRNVCISENPGVPSNQTYPWPPVIAPQSLCCKMPAANQSLVWAFYAAFISFSSVLMTWVRIFSFPTLINPAYSKSSTNSFGKDFIAFIKPSMFSNLRFVCYKSDGADFQLFHVSSFKAMSTHVTTGRRPSLAHTMLTHLEWKAAWECLLICALTQSH